MKTLKTSLLFAAVAGTPAIGSAAQGAEYMIKVLPTAEDPAQKPCWSAAR